MRQIDIGTMSFYLTIDNVNTILQMLDDIESEWSRLNDGEKEIKEIFEAKKAEMERSQNGNRNNRS